MTINRDDGLFQACYWRDAAKIAGEPDDVEYSDFLMELKARINTLFRQRQFEYAAIFRWDEAAKAWEPVEEFERRR